MSTSHSKSALAECSDCSELNPPWASLNRCVLMCDACCSIHRSLGRHLSQVKSLTHQQWRETQLKMLHQVVSGGSNKIWEYLILDPKRNRDNVRKPRPCDPLHPVKADFIKQKYQLLAFCKRYKNNELCSLEDMNMQLHASVRTPNLETSFRLLSLGANPNFYHPHKRNTPLHVATQERQGLQVELLLVYGASPTLPDGRGATPISIAERMQQQQPQQQQQQQQQLQNSLAAIRQSLVEAQYELTDRFSLYLCGRQPTHQLGVFAGAALHFLLPDRGDDRSPEKAASATKEGRVRLATLPDRVFQELCRDLYDELDRRDNNRIVQLRCRQATSAFGVLELFFLPLSPHYSSTRNQGRQKLGRLSGREFGAILSDSLEEAARRCGLQPSEMVRARFSRQQQLSSSLDSIVDTAQLQQEQHQPQRQLPQQRQQQHQQQQRCKSEFHASSRGPPPPPPPRSDARRDDPVYDTVPVDSEYASINPPQLRQKKAATANPANPQEASKPIPASAAEAPARNAKSELCTGTSGPGDLASAAAGGREERKEILQPVASLAGATSAVTAASEQTGELTALRTMNARLAEENRQLRQRVDQLMAQNSDLSARLQQLLAARSVPASQPPAGSPTPPTPPPPLSPASCRSRNNSSASNYSAGCGALNTGVLLRAGIRQAAAAAAAAAAASSPSRPHTTIGQHQHHQHHRRLQQQQHQQHQRYQNLEEVEPLPPPQLQSADNSTNFVANSTPQPPPPPPPPLLLSSPMSAACMARPTPVVPPTVPESSAVDEAAAAEARSDGDGEGEVDADVLTPVGQQLDINVDEVNCVDIDFDNLEAAEGGGAAACSAAAAATAVDDGDADYDQPPAETDEEDDEMCNERRPPTQEEVVARTEAITSEIYKMLEAARSGSHENFSEQSGRVRQAVLRMTAIAPRTQAHQRQAVDALLTAADTLSAECRSPPSPSELSRRTQQVIQCCFDIAKAAKALVTLFQ
ncbi:hypothetical protein BOX15_Mlig007453g1 [Macrostomum lignano]|uniref:Arf-GAP domain-containing protein n=1 Tax=Macrostomum lignano TaxID=282301 RepID=A0A267F4G1_9PLAT|nr:hypothetical protein BOX15_Mlig007453g1 [Macrostomum lignano]